MTIETRGDGAIDMRPRNYIFKYQVKSVQNHFQSFLKRYQNEIPYFLFGLLGVIVFGKVVGFKYFIFDDGSHIYLSEPMLRHKPADLIWFWKNTAMPVILTVWWFIALLFGVENPMPFHCFNLLLHLVNSTLVILLIQEIFLLLFKSAKTSEIKWASFFGGAVFLLHPVQAEVAAWSSCGKDLLATFFGLLCLRVYFQSRASGKLPEPFTKKAIQFYLFFALSFFSKVPAAALLPLCLWLDLAFFRFSWKKVLKLYGPVLMVILLGYFQLRATPQAEYLSFVPTGRWRLYVILDALSFYFSKVLTPISLYFDYGHMPFRVIRGALFSPGIYVVQWVSVVLILSAIVGSCFIKKFRPLHLGLIIFLVMILPYTGIIPFAFQNVSTTADRYFYFSIFGFAIFLAVGFHLIPFKKWKPYAAGTLILLFAMKTTVQVGYWKDSESILRYTIKNNPVSFASHVALGKILVSQGKTAEGGLHFQTGNNLMEEARHGF